MSVAFTPEPWTEEALCAEIDPDLWHPNCKDSEDTETAIAICKTCPVRYECLEYALSFEGGRSAKQRYGIYGGTTPTRRASIYRSDRRKREEAAV